MGACINRLFRQLGREVQENGYPQRRAIAYSSQLDRISFRPWDDVRLLVEAARGGSRQEKICSLIEMIPATAKVEAIVTPNEALEILQKHRERRLLATEAVDILQDRCAEKYAREYLLLLHKMGAIRLIQGSSGSAGGAVLGDRQYLWVELL